MIFGKKDKNSKKDAPLEATGPDNAGARRSEGAENLQELYKMPWDENSGSDSAENLTGRSAPDDLSRAEEEQSAHVTAGNEFVAESPSGFETEKTAPPEGDASTGTGLAEEGGETFEANGNKRPDGPADAVRHEGPEGPDVAPAIPSANGASGPSLALPPLSFLPSGSPTALSRVYGVLAWSPFVTITLLVLLQTIFTLDARALWYSDEIRHANVLQNLLQHGDWLVLHLNGLPYPDKPPLYFWFLAGIQAVMPYFGINAAPAAPIVMFAGVALSGLFFCWAVLAMARWVGGVNRHGRLAAGLVAVSCVFISGLFHYARMDLLFSALIGFSLVFIFNGLRRERSIGLMLPGFFLAGLAVMVKGPLGLVFPLLGVLLFIFWSGTPRRVISLDFLLGLLAGLLPGLVWLAAAWFGGHEDFVREIISNQIIGRAIDAEHHAAPWFHYLATFPLVWLPWTFLLFFLPWEDLFKKQTWRLLQNSRKGERQGLAFLFLTVAGGFVFLSLVSTKIPIYLLPLMAPLAVLTGRAALGLSGRRCRWFQRVLGLFFIVLAVDMLLAAMFYSGDVDFFADALASFGIPAWPVEIQGTIICALVLLVCASLFLGALKGARPEGMLLLAALTLTAVSYPLFKITAPSLDSVLSPAGQAAAMRSYIDKGYHSMTFAMYSGTYSYYTDAAQDEVPKDWAELARKVNSHSAVVLAMSANKWKEWKEMQPEGEAAKDFHEISRQWIAEREYVLLLKGPDAVKAAEPENAPPAGPAPKPEPEQGDGAAAPSGPELQNPGDSAVSGEPGHEPENNGPGVELGSEPNPDALNPESGQETEEEKAPAEEKKDEVPQPSSPEPPRVDIAA